MGSNHETSSVSLPIVQLYIPAVLGVRTTHGDAMFPTFDVITNCHEMCHCVPIRFAWEQSNFHVYCNT